VDKFYLKKIQFEIWTRYPSFCSSYPFFTSGFYFNNKLLWESEQVIDTSVSSGYWAKIPEPGHRYTRIAYVRGGKWRPSSYIIYNLTWFITVTVKIFFLIWTCFCENRAYRSLRHSVKTPSFNERSRMNAEASDRANQW